MCPKLLTNYTNKIADWGKPNSKSIDPLIYRLLTEQASKTASYNIIWMAPYLISCWKSMKNMHFHCLVIANFVQNQKESYIE